MARAKIFSNDEMTTLQKENISAADLSTQHDWLTPIINECSAAVAPVWPTANFVATNPLQGFEDQPFFAVLEKVGLSAQRATSTSLAAVNREMIKWCSAFFDRGQAVINMPHREKGLYCCFAKLAYLDRNLHQNNPEKVQWLRHLPANALEAIFNCLERLRVTERDSKEFIQQQLEYLPGWSGYVKWYTNWQNEEDKSQNLQMEEYVALRLIITAMLWPEAGKADKVPLHFPSKLFNEPFLKQEELYKKNLLQQLRAANHFTVKTQRRDVQFVFCIDVRSEPLRRRLEHLGNYETFGFAGFFGLAIRTKDLICEKPKDCCPVLLKPQYSVNEALISANASNLKKLQKARRTAQNLSQLYQQTKYNFSTPFALAEMLGPWSGLTMLAKTIAPRFSKKIKTFFSNSININPDKISRMQVDNLLQQMPLEEQIANAEQVLRLMGLTAGFAKLIVLCAHGSTTENNPYASSFNCGACGGHHGDINASLLAALLNSPQVRHGLEDRGIHIPLDTVFYSALHNTTTNSVELLHSADEKNIYPAIMAQLKKDLIQAQYGTSNSRETVRSLKKSMDWSETRPEWGLARNAAFIIAPREMSKGIDLEGRCFLHSYNWQEDDAGNLLETILTAPMIVAEWINMQYLFSTLDNVNFGSGSKITHNIVGKIGIMQGNASDLMHGLPLQSVMSDDKQTYHQPQRLLTVVYAPRQRLTAIIARQTILQKLFHNEWVHLIVVDPQDQQFYSYKNGNYILL